MLSVSLFVVHHQVAQFLPLVCVGRLYLFLFLSTFSLDEWNGKFNSNITEFDGELIMFNLDTDHGIPLVVPLVELAAGEVLAVLAVEGAVAQV